MKFPAPPTLLRAAALVTLAAGCAQPPSAPATPAARSSSAVLAEVPAVAPLSQHAEAAGGLATSIDEQGVPRFIWGATRQAPAAGTTHEAAAHFHMARFARALALSPAALAVTAPVFVADHGDRGVVVHLRQRVGGLEVYRRELRLLMRQDHSLVALSGALHPSTEVVSGAGFVRSPEEVLAAALSHATGSDVAAASVIDLQEREGDEARYQLAAGGAITIPDGAVVRKVLFADGDKLRPAFSAEFYVTTDAGSQAWRYALAADDGKILERVSLTQYDSFNYKVFANPVDKRPLDGPIGDWTPHPTGRADWSYPPFVAPTMIAMEGFNHNPQGAADPWLPANAKDTTGNNAEAYTDRSERNAPQANDFHATLSAPLTFDYTYNLAQPPTVSKQQTMAGIVQAFYDVNFMHDYWYDSGFDEKAGNGQKDNYGRGGKPNDALRLEVQDGLNIGNRDNSNMSTLGDGYPPRMQIYVWSGSDTRVLHATPPDADEPSGTAQFGPDKFDLKGELVDINDGAFPSTTDACEPIINDVSGKIAIIDRGNCTFKKKAVNAEMAGAIGVLIINNVQGGSPIMGNGDPTATVVNIPVLSSTKPTGAALRSLMASGPVTVHLGRVRDIDREGSLDNSVLFHEWGHYLHHRLSDCGNTQQCGALSEGWADFTSLQTIVRDGDNLDGTYALAIYASAQFDDPAYFGIRRFPYTTNMRKNGLTLKHITDGEPLPTLMPQNGGGSNAEVHNAGEVWTSMMWEVYVALQKAGRARTPSLSFEEVRRRMSEYVVTGLQMMPVDATYLESRDAMLAAAGAVSDEDRAVMADAFARRGAGTCADAPARSSSTLDGVIEGFKVQARLVINNVALDDSIKTCDSDGVLDSGEHGKLTIDVSNGALSPLVGAKLTLSTTTPGVSFVGPSTFDIPDLDPFKSTTLTTEVMLDPATANPGVFVLKIDPSSDAACETGTREVSWKINYDVGKQSTRSDDVENDDVVWTLDGDESDSVWSRVPTSASNHVWHGANLDHPSDTSLESPDLVVSKTDFFLIRFEHRHSFDARNSNNGTRIYLDGGVVEISEDGGMTWNDFTMYANPLYDNTLPDLMRDNALAGRKAFVDKNFAWPKFDRVTMNLLDKFAGKTVRVRFRIGTDDDTGESGWDIDNISFSGIDNTPFTGNVFDAGKCGTGPRGPAAQLPTSGCTIGARRGSATALLLVIVPAALAIARRRRRR